ncbi:MAG TPA: hypothetical protein DCZ95_03655 [Verrucomicrobia bacterium]|nr:MAG: hypothetical protein A2X46_01310 [Lentisphaerae bacterium GWF2_57_35]HBA83170.1 hypothetical protein [Verrucomicrobiota bacterium]
MIIEIPKVSAEGAQYTGEENPSILGLEDNQLVRVEGPIRYDFFVQIVSQELIVQGSLNVKLQVRCSKCAEFFSTTLADLSFLRAYEITGSTSSVDVTGDIREELLLDVPSFPVCSDACKGLCPQCGKNLNEGKCGCRPPSGNDGWSALDSLKLS